MSVQSQKKYQRTNKPEVLTSLFNQNNKWWLIFALVIITFVTFSPSLKNDFVRWDDHTYVTENELIKEISIDNLGKFSENVAGNFHPLTMISLAIDYHFFGLNPFYFHLKNLIFHLLNTILVFFFILKLSKGNYFIAFFTSLLFGIHPMHVESVVWISERKDVLYSFYFLIGLLTYYKYQNRKKIIFYFITGIAFILSSMAKSAAVVFPVILILIDYFENEKIVLNKIIGKIPFIIISLVIGIIAIKTQSDSNALQNAQDFNFFERLQIASSGFLIYIKKFFLPTNLVHLHPYPDLRNTPFPYTMAILGVGIILSLTIKYREKFKCIFFGLMYYAVTMILVLQLIPIGNAFISERYTYIPYIGLAFTFFSFIDLSVKHFKKYKFQIIVTITLPILFFTKITFAQNKVWKNTLSLWNNFIENYPTNSDFGYLNRASYYLEKNEPELALADINKAIELNANNYRAYTSRGKYYLDQNMYDLALENYNKALSLKNDFQNAILGRGITNYFLANFKYAIIDFNTLIRIDDENPEYYNYRGNSFYELKEFNKAISDFDSALFLRKDYIEAQNNRTAALLMLGDSSAIKQYNSIVDIKNDYVALTNRGALYYKNKNLDSAFVDFNDALKLNDKYPNALKGRANIFFDRKEYNNAINDITEYLKLDPSNLDMLQRRAFCYLYTNQLDNALNDYTLLINSRPKDGRLYESRGFLNMQLGNNENALQDFLTANELGIEIDPKIFNTLRTK